MKKDLIVERLFPLGDFKNVKFGTVLRDIPDELAENKKVTDLLYFQLALSCDIAYRRYFDTIDRITKEQIKDVLGYLEKERSQALSELYEEIKNNVDLKKETE